MSIHLKPLKEQVIVITGGSSGIGLATAFEAVKRGAAVVIASRNKEELERASAKLKALGGRVVICEADVADPIQVEHIAETAVQEFGGFDTWVNNAAASVYGSMEEMDWEDHKQVFDVNYFGLLKGSLVAVQHLRQRGGGAIINVGSVLSDRTILMQGAYSASKHAVLAATDALRMELQRTAEPISVTLIKPSAIHTPYPEHARNYMNEPSRVPPVLYDPLLVADAILFAAEHPKRDLYVGGMGFIAAKMGQMFPRLTDKMMQAFGVPLQESSEEPGNAAMHDNLYEPPSEGQIEGTQDFYVRRHSMYLEMQKYPVATFVALSSVLLIGALILTNSLRRAK